MFLLYAGGTRRVRRQLVCMPYFYLVITSEPNQSPEPMRVGAGSSASRLDDFWSRMAQLFSLGIKIGLRFYSAGWFGEDLSSLIQMSKLSAVSQDSARAGLSSEQVRSRLMCERLDLPDCIMNFTSLMPNKTLEPTADGAVSSAVAVHATRRRWLSFLSLGVIRVFDF
jgi:hypothetical protein